MRALLWVTLVGLLLVSTAGAERERLSRRLQQASPKATPPKAATPAKPTLPAATKPIPAKPTTKATPKPICTTYSGQLINSTAVLGTPKAPITNCTAEAARKAAILIPNSKVNGTAVTYVGTATNCTVVKGVVTACQPFYAVLIKSPVLPPVPLLPSPTPSPPAPPAKKKKSSSVGPAVGGAIGGIAALAILAALAWFFVGKKRAAGGDPYATGKQPFRATPDAAAARDQGNLRPTTFVVGKDPAMLSRRHEDLKQAIQSFEARFQPIAPPAFWQRLVAQAPALEAAVDAGPLGAYLLRHHIWRWFDAKLWSDNAPLAKPPIFPRGRTTASFDSALTELKANPETFQQFTAQVARDLADDLRLPSEGEATYEKDLQYLAECAVELRLAAGVVDQNAAILVAPTDTRVSPLQLRVADKSQQVFRSLPIDPRARSRVTAGVALCHVPGIGHYSRSYTYEVEQVVATARG